jgi:hypothetical protein
MKRTFTYKELTIALGILVAIAVIFTIWVSEPQRTSSYQSIRVPEITFRSAKSVIMTAVEIIF